MSKYFYRVMMGLGLLVFFVILGSADFSLLLCSIEGPLWLAVLSLVFISVLLQSVTFGIMANIDFSQGGKFWYFWRKSLQATVANAGVPLSGSASKVASLKANENIAYVDGVRSLVSVAGARGFVACFALILSSPFNFSLKMAASVILLLVLVFWLLTIPKFQVSKLLRPFQPLAALTKLKSAFAVFVVELCLLMIAATALWLLISTFDLRLQLSTVIFIHSLGLLVTLLPITPLGLGTRDAVLFGLFVLYGIEEGASASIVVLERVILLVAILAAWLTSLPFTNGHGKQKKSDG